MQEKTPVHGSLWVYLPALIEARFWFLLSFYYFLYIPNKFINFSHIPASQTINILKYKLKLSDTHRNKNI